MFEYNLRLTSLSIPFAVITKR